jgi:hypothetical protein
MTMLSPRQSTVSDDLGDWFAIGGVVLEDLRRPAIQPVGQFLDGLHVADRSLFRCARVRFRAVS